MNEFFDAFAEQAGSAQRAFQRAPVGIGTEREAAFALQAAFVYHDLSFWYYKRFQNWGTLIRVFRAAPRRRANRTGPDRNTTKAATAGT